MGKSDTELFAETRLRTCRECKEDKKLSEFSLDRGKYRRLCKKCAVNAQSKRYYGQGALGREKALKNWQNYAEKEPVRIRFNLGKSSAKQFGHRWELTFEQFAAIVIKPCHYCGGPLPPRGRGLDRIDNKLGYSVENVLPCCTDCNRMRGNYLTVEETMVAAHAISRLRKVGKGTNPKDMIGSRKLPLSLVPATSLALQAMAHLHGALKYGAWNWRASGVRTSIYYDAMLRHLNAWYNGQDLDQDSGLPHLAHVMACANILIDAKECNKLSDDRPPQVDVASLQCKLNDVTKQWVDAHNNAKP